MSSVGLRVLRRWAATKPKGSVEIATSIHRDREPGANHDVTIQESRLWLDPPSRWRYEVDTHGAHTGVFVADGPLFWSYAPSVHAISNESDPSAHPVQSPHQEWEFFHASELERRVEARARRSERRGGRDVDVVEGVARDDSRAPLMPGADSYELVIDRERDIAMRVAARAEGIEYLVVEIIDLALNIPLADDLFRISLPAGTTFGPPPTLRAPTVADRIRRLFGRGRR